jgi:hypothetical protein
MSDQGATHSRLHFGAKNSICFGAAVVSLVLGYCVFFPVGLAL